MTSWRTVDVIDTFPRRNATGNHFVRVSISAFGAKFYGDVRLCYRDERTGEIKPRKQGLTLNWLALWDLHRALGRLLEVLDEDYGGTLADNPSLRAHLDSVNNYQ